MNKNQYYNQHRNLDIHKAEMERKWRAYIREQEEMELARMHAIYEAQQQQQSVVTSPGAGGGGNGFNQLGFGVRSVLYGTDRGDGVNTPVIQYAYTLDVTNNKITKAAFDLNLSEWNPIPDNAYINKIQNGGYTSRVTRQDDTLERLIFIDGSGNLLENIELTLQDGDPNNYYVYDYMYTEMFGHVYVYRRYEGGNYAGQTVIWFNGWDNAVVHELNNPNYYIDIIGLGDRTDRRGNFNIVIYDEINPSIEKYYTLGKKLLYICDVDSSQADGLVYSRITHEETVFLEMSFGNYAKRLIFISSDQTIIKDLDISGDLLRSPNWKPYGAAGQTVFRLYNAGSDEYYYYQCNGALKTVSGPLIVNVSNYYGEDYGITDPYDSEQKFVPGAFAVIECTNYYGNSSGGRYGRTFVDFKLHYIAGSDSEWHTYESPNFFIEYDQDSQPRRYLSNDGVYVITDNGGSENVYVMYLSGGKETFAEVGKWAWQNESYVGCERFGVSSIAVTTVNSTGTDNVLFVVKEGKLVGGDVPTTRYSTNSTFGIYLLQDSDNLLNLFWYAEEAGKWTKLVASPNENFAPLYQWVLPEGNSINVNVQYFGCAFPIALLPQYTPNQATWHLFSNDAHTSFQRDNIEGWSVDDYVLDIDSYVIDYSNGNQRYIRRFTPKGGLVAEQETPVTNGWFENPFGYAYNSSRATGSFYAAPGNTPPMTLFLLGDNGTESVVFPSGIWWSEVNDNY